MGVPPYISKTCKHCQYILLIVMSRILYSYADLMSDRWRFRATDHEGIHRYDVPNALYFKILFYFADTDGFISSAGLDLNEENDTEKRIKARTPAYKDPGNLGDTGEDGNCVRGEVYNNTALNYLLLNDELERAELLKSFISLLSSISNDSPWYFKELSGLEGALERKMFNPSDGFKIDEAPRQISIKCLADAYDDRIGTLLDLYRAICYSYSAKKEIVPANLRKFNMAIAVFPAPLRGITGKSGTPDNAIRIPIDNEDKYVPNLKIIELRNCEFDYNSSKSAWSTLTTEDLFHPEYTINISYADAYEKRYNEIMGRVIPDSMTIDIKGKRDDATTGYKDTDTIGQAAPIDDTQAIGIPKTVSTLLGNKNSDPDKEYWTDTDPGLNMDPYSRQAVNTSDSVTSFETQNGPISNMVDTYKKNVKKKISSLVAIPSKKKTENIHDNGTVQATGKYEYLNRMQGTGGLLGGALQDNVLGPMAELTNNVQKNISKMMEGDFDFSDNLGKVSKPNRSNQAMTTKEILPGYDKERTDLIGKLSEAASLRNNL